MTKQLSRLSMDPEPGIRTNTVVCLGKLSRYFDDSVGLFMTGMKCVSHPKKPFSYALLSYL